MSDDTESRFVHIEFRISSVPSLNRRFIAASVQFETMPWETIRDSETGKIGKKAPMMLVAMKMRASMTRQGKIGTSSVDAQMPEKREERDQSSGNPESDG